jgi:hypothetical protein
MIQTRERQSEKIRIVVTLLAHCIGKSNIIRKLDDIPSRERVFTQR